MTSHPLRLGRYELVERFGAGGMAELYRAVIVGPMGFRKTVAIKKILPDLAGDPRFREMFLHEGTIMGRLGHRNLVQLFELGEEGDELYLCFEYVPGCDLAQILSDDEIRRDGIVPPLTAFIARELCEGLAYVHAFTDEDGRPLHIVHRDVNPNNILLSRQGDVKLGDFGIAKSIVMGVRTQQGQVRGKLQYLSPEQARGEVALPASDIYAVGLVLYEMLTGLRPIQGATEIEILRFACAPTFRPVEEINPTVDPDLAGITARALRVDPEARFATAADMGRALSQVIGLAPTTPGAGEVSALVDRVRRRSPRRSEHQLIAATREDFDPSQHRRLSTPPTAIAKASVLEAPPHTVSLPGFQSPAPRARARRAALLGTLVAVFGLAVLISVAWRSAIAPEGTSRDTRSQPPALHPTGTGLATDTPGGGVRDSGPIAQTRDGAVPDHLSMDHRRPPRVRAPSRAAAVATSPRAEGKSSTRELRRELERQTERLRARGVRRYDSPKIDRLRSRADRQISAGKYRRASSTIKALDEAVDALVIDRGFIERKIARLQRALSRRGREAEFEATRREILGHAVNNRFQEANQAINRAFREITAGEARP